MRQRLFDQLPDHLGQLSRHQLSELIQVTKEISGAQQAAAVIKAARFDDLACPDCKGRQLYRPAKPMARSAFAAAPAATHSAR